MDQLECQCQIRYASGFVIDVNFKTSHLVTAIFGPSGSGKSSLLECIAGLRTPHSGSIHLNGEALFDSQQKIHLPPERRPVGLVFQEHLLFPHLNVEANLRYGERRANRREIHWQDVVRVLELSGLLKRLPAELSGGERQRVALGRAIVSGPQLLLMDEPLAALDESLKQRILGYLQSIIAEWQIPVLFVSHSQAEVRQLANFVVVLKQGEIVTQGQPEEVFGDPELLAWSNGAGPTNLLRLSEVKQESEHHIARVGEHSLWLPPFPKDAKPPQFVEFEPGSVILAGVDDAGLSARNHLPGIVRKLVPLPQGTFVAVDIGQIIWALITPEAAAELQLAPDHEVICILKTHSLKFSL